MELRFPIASRIEFCANAPVANTNPEISLVNFISPIFARFNGRLTVPSGLLVPLTCVVAGSKEQSKSTDLIELLVLQTAPVVLDRREMPDKIAPKVCPAPSESVEIPHLGKLMSKLAKVFFSGDLSATWFGVEHELAASGFFVFNKCSGTPEETLAYCCPRAPCILVVDDAFINHSCPRQV